MKKLFALSLIVVFMAFSLPAFAKSPHGQQRSVGPASFYLAIKDKLGITKDQEKKLIEIEKKALQKLEKITGPLNKARRELGNLTREDNIDLKRTKKLLSDIAKLEADGKYVIIEAIALEKKVLTKDQLRKAEKIASDMVRGHTNPHTGNHHKK